MNYKRVIKTLTEARDVLVKYGWCQGALARAKSGHEVIPTSPNARSFCSEGAMRRAVGGFNGKKEDIFEEAVSALQKVVANDVTVWNDSKGRRKSQVLAAFDAAIAKADADMLIARVAA